MNEYSHAWVHGGQTEEEGRRPAAGLTPPSRHSRRATGSSRGLRREAALSRWESRKWWTGIAYVERAYATRGTHRQAVLIIAQQLLYTAVARIQLL